MRPLAVLLCGSLPFVAPATTISLISLLDRAGVVPSTSLVLGYVVFAALAGLMWRGGVPGRAAAATVAILGAVSTFVAYGQLRFSGCLPPCPGVDWLGAVLLWIRVAYPLSLSIISGLAFWQMEPERRSDTGRGSGTTETTPPTERAVERSTFIRTATMWSACALVPIGAYQILRGDIGTEAHRVAILVIALLLIGSNLLGERAGALALVSAGLLVASPTPIDWLLFVLSPSPSLTHTILDSRWVAGMTVGFVAILMAVWRRPPSRGPDGRNVTTSRLLNALALLFAVGGPAVGWFGLSAFAPGDIYMRPLVAGLVVGAFGLLLFSGYSAFYRLLRRPSAAVVLAAVYPVLLVLAAGVPSFAFAPRTPPAGSPSAGVQMGEVEARLADGRVVRASSATAAGPPGGVLDGRLDVTWNAGRHPPAWVEIDLGRDVPITAIRLLPAQLPTVARTLHRVYGRHDGEASAALLAELAQTTEDNVWVEAILPSVSRVRYVRVETVTSPSWVAWREIDVIVEGVAALGLAPDGHHDGSADSVAIGDRCYANGWASDPDDRAADVTVRILVDGSEVWLGVAELPREDVRTAGFGDGTSGFWVPLRQLITPGVPHVVRVQAQDAQSTTWSDLGGTPRTISCRP